LVDDASHDETVEKGKRLGIKHIISHEQNRGYGGNQKTCYDTALKLEADIVIMLHPDYQYTPKLIIAMVSIIGNDLYPVVFCSRIICNRALKGGLTKLKYIANRFLTLTQNILCGQKLSEYHTGYRSFSRTVLESIDYHKNSDDFIFDNQMIAQIFAKGFDIGEVTCPTKYFDDASSINLQRSMTYGFGVLGVSFRYFLHRVGFRWSILS
jgi:glycosyltransferase involved in cell wall biosynthesis